MSKVNEWLLNKTIKTAEVDGFGIKLEFEDGSKFVYDATDGGYSSWECKDGTGENKSEVITKYTIIQQVMKDGKKVWVRMGSEYSDLQKALKDLVHHQHILSQNVYRLAKKTETKWEVMKDEN